jgi:hypothetical protein
VGIKLGGLACLVYGFAAFACALTVGKPAPSYEVATVQVNLTNPTVATCLDASGIQ